MQQLTPEMQQMLLNAIAQKNESQVPDELATGAGAAVGGLAGVGIAQAPHMVGKGLGAIRGTNRMMKPGLRMAGGLAGLLGGGALGPAIAQQFNSSSPEAELLARIQTGTTAPGDELVLQRMLADQYNKIGIA